MVNRNRKVHVQHAIRRPVLCTVRMPFFSDFVLLCVVYKAYIAYVKHGSSIGRPLELHLALMGTESLLLQQRTV